jgi:hypothetical protein
MDSWPLQLIVVALPEEAPPAGILDLLQASRANGAIRLIDGGIVRKGDEGELSLHRAPALHFDTDPRTGQLAHVLFGCDASGRVKDWSVGDMCRPTAAPYLFGLSADDLAEIADEIPRASNVLVLLIEHRWTSGFMESVQVERGTLLAQGSVVPRTMYEVCEHEGFAAGRP